MSLMWRTTRIARSAERGGGGGGGMSRFARPLVPGMPSRVVDSNGVVKRQDSDTRRLYDEQFDQETSGYVSPKPERPSGEGELVVGPEIRFKGEISSCDTLIVHGHVEAALPARAMRIGESGEYLGTAEVDEAEIAGLFNGTLTVRRRLTIAAGGKVRGTIRYAQLEIAAGGEISGDVGLLEQEPRVADTSVDQAVEPSETQQPLSSEHLDTEAGPLGSEEFGARRMHETVDSPV